VSLPRDRRPRSGGLVMGGALLAAAGLAAFVGGVLTVPRQALFSFLAAFASAVAVAVGALVLLLATNIVRADWVAPLRGAAGAAAGTLPLLGLLFVPVALGLPRLYPWAGLPGAVPAGSYPDPEVLRVYLNGPAFVLRSLLYFGIWIATLAALRRWPGRRRAVSAAALPAVALAVTFAAFDWLMSLAPGWVSTVYGLYYFSGGFAAALGLLALVAPGAAHTDSHSGDGKAHPALGVLLLTFVVFWAYLGFAQLLIIWIADVPTEVAWYAPRLRGGWGALGLLILAGHFVLPALALLLHRVKRDPSLMASVGALVLIMHHLDIYWLVLPELHPRAPQPHWTDAAALALVVGAAGASAGRRTARRDRGSVEPASAVEP
jgi:hypothetical protein